MLHLGLLLLGMLGLWLGTAHEERQACSGVQRIVEELRLMGRRAAMWKPGQAMQDVMSDCGCEGLKLQHCPKADVWRLLVGTPAAVLCSGLRGMP